MEERKNCCQQVYSAFPAGYAPYTGRCAPFEETATYKENLAEND